MACSEIRAARLSGDCDLMQEVLRGNFMYSLEKCVKRRAKLAVQEKDCVDVMFSKCFNNKEPF